jgi:hypothetical protein
MVHLRWVRIRNWRRGFQPGRPGIGTGRRSFACQRGRPRQRAPVATQLHGDQQRAIWNYTRALQTLLTTGEAVATAIPDEDGLRDLNRIRNSTFRTRTRIWECWTE